MYIKHPVWTQRAKDEVPIKMGCQVRINFSFGGKHLLNVQHIIRFLVKLKLICTLVLAGPWPFGS